MTYDSPKATYKFGTYADSFTLSMTHTQDTAYGVQVIPLDSSTMKIELKPWTLNHVDSISETGSSQASIIGIPNKPAECAQIFDVNGPIRTFVIQGRRYDSEEEVSNLDFFHTQFNPQHNPPSYIPFSGDPTPETYYSIGIEWLTSTLQTTLRGYTFIIEIQSDDTRLQSETVNVGLTSFTYSFDADNPGLVNYSLTFVERKEYPNGPIYREYVSPISRSNP